MYQVYTMVGGVVVLTRPRFFFSFLWCTVEVLYVSYSLQTTRLLAQFFSSIISRKTLSGYMHGCPGSPFLQHRGVVRARRTPRHIYSYIRSNVCIYALRFSHTVVSTTSPTRVLPPCHFVTCTIANHPSNGGTTMTSLS